jgi:hypothetical protein
MAKHIDIEMQTKILSLLDGGQALSAWEIAEIFAGREADDETLFRMWAMVGCSIAELESDGEKGGKNKGVLGLAIDKEALAKEQYKYYRVDRLSDLFSSGRLTAGGYFVGLNDLEKLWEVWERS